MNKDFRHKKVKSTSPAWTWLEEMQRRVANATRRHGHCGDHEGQELI